VRRPLAEEERAALDFLLTADFPGVDELRLQAPAMQVVGRCPCGCATIEFEVDADRAPAAVVVPRVPVEASGADKPFGLLLFVDDGHLSSLEIWSTDDEMWDTFPPPSAFETPRPAAP
jgi:hypothetical protein